MCYAQDDPELAGMFEDIQYVSRIQLLGYSTFVGLPLIDEPFVVVHAAHAVKCATFLLGKMGWGLS